MPNVHVHTFIGMCVHPLQLLNQFTDVHKTWYEIMPLDITQKTSQSIKTMQEMHKVMKWEQYALPFI